MVITTQKKTFNLNLNLFTTAPNPKTKRNGGAHDKLCATQRQTGLLSQNSTVENPAQIDEANDALSDQEDDAFDLDDRIQWLRDEYDVELVRDGVRLSRPCEANTF